MEQIKFVKTIQEFIIGARHIDVQINTCHITIFEAGKTINCYELDRQLCMFWGHSRIKIFVEDIKEVMSSKDELTITLPKEEKIILKKC